MHPRSIRNVVAMSSSQCVNRRRACIVVNRDNYSEYDMRVHVVWQSPFFAHFKIYAVYSHLTMAKIIWTY